ncbi:hypothetical protein HPP92_021464 [Vanilla planifolia]|uniref:Uncharacterized protein n=1 Tax=Vanilla planifolia TaxID=51239 RepID=A0A835UGU6_VANPL|nr:hypothetical protein HPP92_021464 [Vanilla planifolia]
MKPLLEILELNPTAGLLLLESPEVRLQAGLLSLKPLYFLLKGGSLCIGEGRVAAGCGCESVFFDRCS